MKKSNLKPRRCPPSQLWNPVHEKCVDKIVMFHGTSTRNFNNIDMYGLKDPYICLSMQAAQYFAMEEVDKKGGDPLILSVSIDASDKKRLRPDFPMFEEPILEVLEGLNLTRSEYDEKMRRDKIPFPKNNKDWRTSLDVVGSIRYEGIVPREKMEVGAEW